MLPSDAGRQSRGSDPSRDNACERLGSTREPAICALALRPTHLPSSNRLTLVDCRGSLVGGLVRRDVESAERFVLLEDGTKRERPKKEGKEKRRREVKKWREASSSPRRQ